ncbi:Sulfhydryl oxidase [Seminavis robusta]|uniref:Sulfhydryl oxidase n=1 Tax=Seminavis robusta TaxID=568900 RepID=A0A9N8HMN2_9STRA|nr:Sulfhydryl oxidase [Seminavis robusta]|eukprot:Sro1013_g231360.1 Sulfhydryl oxidase (719) ;mRNA; r:37368-39591
MMRDDSAKRFLKMSPIYSPVVFFWWLLLLLQLPLTAAAIQEYLYRSMNPPTKALPVMDYYSDDTNNKDSIPDFLSSDTMDHPRVVEFYSPTCPHCQAFAPQYVQFANDFGNWTAKTQHSSASLGNVQFHAVSCSVHKTVCRQESIRNYPTIKVIPAYKTSAAAVQLQDYQLHAFKLATILGAEAVPSLPNLPPQPQVPAGSNNRIRRPPGKHVVSRTAKNNNRDKLLVPIKKKKAATPPLSRSSSRILTRTQTEVFTDAYLSFFRTMKDSVFMAEGPLAKDRKVKLKAFLELLQDALPPWKLFHALLDKLLLDFNRIVYHERVWESTLERFAPISSDWSPACQQHGSEYTCGLWSLFHIVTVGVTEYNRHVPPQQQDNKQAYFNMVAAADTIKDFIETFFICQECTRHFVQEYNNCTYHRCERLVQHKNWQQLPLWLAETHNGVNVRLQRTRQSTTTTTTAEQEQNAMWPSAKECSACWLEERGSLSRYDEAILYKYLRLIYWPEDAESRSFSEELKSHSGSTSKAGTKSNKANLSSTTGPATISRNPDSFPKVTTTHSGDKGEASQAKSNDTSQTGIDISIDKGTVLIPSDSLPTQAATLPKPHDITPKETPINSSRVNQAVTSDNTGKGFSTPGLLPSRIRLEGAASLANVSSPAETAANMDSKSMASLGPVVDVQSIVLALLAFTGVILAAKKNMRLQRLRYLSGASAVERAHGL